MDRDDFSHWPEDDGSTPSKLCQVCSLALSFWKLLFLVACLLVLSLVVSVEAGGIGSRLMDKHMKMHLKEMRRGLSESVSDSVSSVSGMRLLLLCHMH